MDTKNSGTPGITGIHCLLEVLGPGISTCREQIKTLGQLKNCRPFNQT